MFKKIKIVIIFVLVFVFTTLTIQAISSDNTLFELNNNDQNFPYIEDQFLKSSRFTQKIDYSEDRINNYLDNYLIKYDLEKYDELGYELVLENDNFLLYFENDSYSIVLVNRDTGFIWSSRAEHQLMTDGNDNARNLMNSGIWIDYVRTNLTNFLETNVSIYSATRAEYYLDGEVSEDIRPYLIKPNSYNRNKVEVNTTSGDNDSIISTINFKELKISFDVKLSLTNSGINVSVLDESIKELDEFNRLTGIYIFPYLGSTRENNVPGYFVIPDGIGALVRFNEQYSNDFNARFYGNDLGYSQRYLANLTMPIYGTVHLDGANAMYANINEGAENTLLQARFWGPRSRYFRISNKFIVRNVFRTVIDREGNGYDSVLNERINGNFNIDFTFLKDEDASYVGIARDYQEKLLKQEVLSKREITNGNNIPLNTSYLMSDRENAFLGTKKVTMTTTDQVLLMYETFKNAGINNQIIDLLGYSKSGNYNRSPYKMSFIDSKNNFKNLTNEISNDNNQIYIKNDYSFASENSNRLSYNNDVARNISKTRILNRFIDINSGGYDTYRLYPDRALRYAKQDFNDVNDLGFTGVSLAYDVNSLYSYSRGNNNYSRTDSINSFKAIYEGFNQVMMSTPNLYALEYASAYMNLPVTNSQYDYYTDLVPLIPVILKGYVSYFTPYLNFNALGKERVLTMIDFAVNPSYILTYEETFKMRQTLSNVFYSTSFSDYENEIIETYNYINDALKEVIDASITSRVVLETGIVLVTYSNNVNIYINYTNKPYSSGSVIVNASDYKVVK